MTIPSYKIHGSAAPGQKLTQTMDFYTVTTAVNIIPTGVITDASQQAFDRLIEIVSINGQPVISDLPTLAAGEYTFKFAIDHTQSWASTTPLPWNPTNNVSAGAALQAAIVANTPAAMGFAADTTLSVVVASSY